MKNGVEGEKHSGYFRGKRLPIVVYMLPEDCDALTALCEQWKMTRAHVIRQSIFTVLSKNGHYSPDSKSYRPKGLPRKQKYEGE